jgi:branched-chain amino acid transport system permease protein
MRSTLLGYGLLALLLAVVWGIEIYQIPWTDMYFASILVRIGINMVAVMGLSLVLGFTGQFSLGHAGFMAIGAYTAAYLNQNFGLPPVPAIVAGAGMAGVGGLAVGLPSLRLSGDYLAVVTLGFNGIIIVLIQNLDALGGALGMINLPQKTSFGLTWSCVVLGGFFFRNLINSPQGRVFKAVRDNEIAVRSLGINTTKAKVTAFVLGSVWAGVAGGLLTFLNASISPPQFDYNRSIELVAMVVLGGTGSLSGPLIAAAVLTALPELLRPIAEYRMILYALLLVVTMILRPGGLLGKHEVGELFEWAAKSAKALRAQRGSP